MHVPDTTEAVFLEAERLQAAGQQERAAIKLVPLVCGHGDPRVRERAATLLALYTADESPGHTPKDVAPVLQPARSVRVPDVPVRRPVSVAQAPRIIPRPDAQQPPPAIAPTARLPSPLAMHVHTYLRLAHGESFHLPAGLAAAVDRVGDQARRMPSGSTQPDMCRLLESVREGFTGPDSDASVFRALVTVFFANDCIGRGHVNALLAGPYAVPRRLIRDLLHGDE